LPCSNATGEPIANPPNSAQLGGSLYHAAKLHPGPCSTVGVRPRTDRQTDTQTHVTTIGLHFASSATHAKCKNTKNPHKCKRRSRRISVNAQLFYRIGPYASSSRGSMLK